jgi:oxygen-independent coproporphyrinogen-3 oxidase
VQSFQPEALEWLRRLHDPAQALSAIQAARDSGIKNLNIDLIFGLPTEVDRDWSRDLDQILSLEVPHLSLYGLTFESQTALGKAVHKGTISPPGDEAYRDQFLEAHRRLVAAGYSHYEVSNFALPGFEAKHNRVYWDGGSYLGLGNSAHSFQPPLRRWNFRDWESYRRSCLDGKAPWEGQEILDPQDSCLEELWLSLRTDRGFPLQDLSPEGAQKVDHWVAEGYARRVEDFFQLTPEGWLLLDELVVELDRVQDQKNLHGLTLPPGVFDL